MNEWFSGNTRIVPPPTPEQEKVMAQYKVTIEKMTPDGGYQGGPGYKDVYKQTVEVDEAEDTLIEEVVALVNGLGYVELHAQIGDRKE